MICTIITNLLHFIFLYQSLLRNPNIPTLDCVRNLHSDDTINIEKALSHKKLTYHS